VVDLGENELRVGAAQSAVMVPSVILILIGGAVADRRDRRTVLMWLHAIAALLAIALAAAVWRGHLSYPLLIVYALGMGSVQAFLMPARDAMLSEVSGHDVGHAVAKLNVTQWGAQALGALAGGLARVVGPASALLVQTAILMLGVPAFGRLSRAPRTAHPGGRLSLADVTSGAREVFHSTVLWPSLILVTAVGALFIGPFMVVFPLMVRDVYGGGVTEIALVSSMFPVGTITGSTAVVWRGGVRRKGRAQLLSLLVGALVLLVISRGLPFWVTLLAVFSWGVSGSVFMIAGRTLFQERASAANRGRVLSTYTLGFMGAAGVVGAPLAGGLVGWLGPRGGLGVISFGMLVVIALVAATTRLARVD
jgi:MFS family permease